MLNVAPSVRIEYKYLPFPVQQLVWIRIVLRRARTTKGAPLGESADGSTMERYEHTHAREVYIPVTRIVTHTHTYTPFF